MPLPENKKVLKAANIKIYNSAKRDVTNDRKNFFELLAKIYERQMKCNTSVKHWRLSTRLWYLHCSSIQVLHKIQHITQGQMY